MPLHIVHTHGPITKNISNKGVKPWAIDQCHLVKHCIFSYGSFALMQKNQKIKAGQMLRCPADPLTTTVIPDLDIPALYSFSFIDHSSFI